MAKARVLAVDDQRYFRDLMEGLLTEEGYAVQTADGGEEGLRILERSDFDIIITDALMPRMDGCELVRQVKQRDPEQEIVVVSGVVDVRTAVDAMKLGASDYILKPFDRAVLTRSIGAILERRRLKEEHARLVDENLEYMGVLSLMERALGLFTCLTVQPLAERLLEGLCEETGARDGVLWLADEEGSDRFGLAAARGELSAEAERPERRIEELSAELPGLGDPAGSLVTDEGLYIRVGHAGAVLGLARLAKKHDGSDFGDRDRATGEKLAEIGGSALANALRVRALEQSSLRDPTTKAYTRVYLQDVLHHELQKASRLGRRFSLLRIDLGGLESLRRRLGDDQLGPWLESLVTQIGRMLRSTDVLAEESKSRYAILLPETDTLGAAILKQRIRGALEGCKALTRLEQDVRPQPLLASATYPSDGTQVEALDQVLEGRLEEDAASLVRSLDLDALELPDAIAKLLERGKPEPPKLSDQITRFIMEEVARRPQEHGLLFLSPGTDFRQTVRSGLEQLRHAPIQTEIAVVAGGDDRGVDGLPISWVAPERVPTSALFLIHYGEGSAYAMVRGTKKRGGAPPLFHTSDRGLVENLAFRLQRELGIPLGT